MQFTAGAPTFTNSGIVTGGNGGAGGGVGGNATPGNPGLGGAGLVGADLAVINSGTISGGLGGDGVTRANAITFTGGTNSLEIWSGSSITGNVVGTGTDTFRLGGTAASASFSVTSIGPAAQYRGFGTFEKVGTGTWSLTGAPVGQAMAWTITQGTLNVSADATLGTAAGGGVTLNGGTFQLGASFGTDAARTFTLNATANTIDTQAFNGTIAGQITGAGEFTKGGAGTLTLSGANTYAGGTTITAGTLALAGSARSVPRPARRRSRAARSISAPPRRRKPRSTSPAGRWRTAR